MGMTTIQPGARVRDRDGVIGVVEHVTDPGNGGGNPLIVRQEESGRLYAFPLQLVSSIREAEGQQFIQLDLPHAALDGYATESAPASEPEVRDAQAVSVPLASEELVTERQPRERGAIGIHKGVEQVERDTEVPVEAEDVEIEHLTPDEYDPATPTQPDEWVIPVHEERLLIRKQTVVKEYLRIRKRSITRQVPVRETLRREYVELNERGPDGQPLEPGSLLRESNTEQIAPDAQ